MRSLCLYFCALFLAGVAYAADPEPILKSAPMPFYPGVARTARIQGKVTLKMTVNSDGDVTDVKVADGHPILRDAATENVKAWKFSWPQPCACTVKRDVIFQYRLTEREETRDAPKIIIKWFDNHVEIEAAGPPVLVNYSGQSAK